MAAMSLFNIIEILLFVAYFGSSYTYKTNFGRKNFLSKHVLLRATLTTVILELSGT